MRQEKILMYCNLYLKPWENKIKTKGILKKELQIFLCVILAGSSDIAMTSSNRAFKCSSVLSFASSQYSHYSWSVVTFHCTCFSSSPKQTLDDLPGPVSGCKPNHSFQLSSLPTCLHFSEIPVVVWRPKSEPWTEETMMNQCSAY